MNDLNEIIEALPSLIQYIYPGLFILWIIKAKITFNYKIELKNEMLYILSISYLVVEISNKIKCVNVLLITIVIMFVIYGCSPKLIKIMNRYFNFGLHPNLFVESSNDLKEDGCNTYAYITMNDGTQINGGLIGVDSTEHPEYISLNAYAVEPITYYINDGEPKEKHIIIKIKDCKHIELKKYQNDEIKK